MSVSHSLSLVDDIRLLPLSGCLPLCVHLAAPQGDSGSFTAPHVALLWPRVKYTQIHLLYLTLATFVNRTCEALFLTSIEGSTALSAFVQTVYNLFCSPSLLVTFLCEHFYHV